MSHPVLAEVWRLLGLAALAALVGWLAGHVLPALLVAAVAVLIVYLRNLARLERWLRQGKKYAPPDARGLWGDVFAGLYKRQQRQRRRNKRLVKLLNRFRESTQAMPDGAVVLRASGDIEWWNAAGAELLGLQYPQDVGQRITNLVRAPDFIDYYNRADYAPGVQIPCPIDAARTVAVRIVPYGKKQRLVLVRDVTRIQQVERMRRDFVANISHELRTPLTVLNGFLESMAEGEEDAGVRPWRRSLQLMQQQTARMNRLVQDLLLLARLESEAEPEAREPVDVPRLLATLREEAVQLSGERGHSIQVEAEPGLLLRGSAKELDSAFGNLLTNAVNYTPAGGEIRVRWYADAQGAHLAVADTGIGIAARHIPRLTERFYRVDVGRSRERGGSGLGLSIVKHVLSRHHAALRVESEPGRGSTFTCDFPPEVVLRRQGAASLSSDGGAGA